MRCVDAIAAVWGRGGASEADLENRPGRAPAAAAALTLSRVDVDSEREKMEPAAGWSRLDKKQGCVVVVPGRDGIEIERWTAERPGGRWRRGGWLRLTELTG